MRHRQAGALELVARALGDMKKTIAASTFKNYMNFNEIAEFVEVAEKVEV